MISTTKKKIIITQRVGNRGCGLLLGPEGHSPFWGGGQGDSRLEGCQAGGQAVSAASPAPGFPAPPPTSCSVVGNFSPDLLPSFLIWKMGRIRADSVGPWRERHFGDCILLFIIILLLANGCYACIRARTLQRPFINCLTEW